MVGQIDSHGLRSHFVVPDRFKCASVGGIDQHHDNGDADSRYNERIQHALECRITSQKVGAVGQRSQLIPLEYGTDDLRESQRSDSQIVALQAEDRKADQICEYRRNRACCDQRHDYRNCKLDDAAVKILIYKLSLLYRNSQYAVGIRSKKHKTCLTQGKQSCKS